MAVMMTRLRQTITPINEFMKWTIARLGGLFYVSYFFTCRTRAAGALVACGKTLLFFLFFPFGANAQTQPTWEIGLAAAGQALPDYRGSREELVQAFPIPFFIYRGKFFRADRDGVRSLALSSKNFEINLSAEAALNADSDGNTLRKGMPELESAFGLGPSFNIRLSGDDFSEGWQLRLPLRAVATVGDSGVHHRGYTFDPRVTYTKLDFFDGWRFRSNTGVIFGSNQFHDYYYEVGEAFATSTRDEYRAQAGFSGYFATASLSRRRGDFWFGARLRYDNLSGATFTDSPLFETHHYVSLSVAMAWVHWKSKK